MIDIYSFNHANDICFYVNLRISMSTYVKFVYHLGHIRKL